MIQWMHALSKSWPAQLLMGALVLSFVMWGIADIFTGVSGSSIASVGGTEIGQADYSRAYRNFVRNQGQQMGTDITPEMAQRMGLPQVALQQMVSRAALDNVAGKLGLTASDSAVAENVRAIQGFRGPLGQFDRATFERRIQEAGYSEQEFLDEIRHDMVRNQLTQAVESSFLIPSAYAQALFLYINERRAADYVILAPEAAGDVPPPSDAVLAAYVKQNAARFSTPEYRDADYARISPEDVQGQVQVTDAMIKSAYDARKDTYVVPEKRDVEQIEFKTEAEAKDARAKIASGMPFETLAASRGLKPADIALGSLTQDGLPDADRAKAIFALPLNEVSQPVKMGFGGWALARVTKIEAGSSRSLDQVRDEIRKTLTAELADAKMVDIVNAFTDARSNGDDLLAAAKKTGMKTGHLKAVDAGGMTADGQHSDAPADPEFLAALFKGEVGGDGEALKSKAGSYFAIAVTGSTPPKLKSLEAVRADALAAWTTTQRTTLLADKAKALAAQADKDKSLDGIAKALNVTVQHSPALSRQTNDTMFSSALTAQLFTTPPGGIAWGPQGLSGNFVIARVTGISHPNPNVPDFRQGAAQLSQSVSGDFSVALASAARTRLGVKVNQKLLDSTVGGAQ